MTSVQALAPGGSHERIRVTSSSYCIRLKARGREWRLDSATARALADALHDHADNLERASGVTA